MLISDAQRDVRDAYIHGAPGLLVSGLVWLVAAVLGHVAEPRTAMLAVFIGGVAIHPLSRMLVRAAGQHATLAATHPFHALGQQAAFIMPLGWPLVVAAGVANPNWYFAAGAVLVAVHYFPFVTLYGKRLFGVVAAVLLVGAFACVWMLPRSFTAAAWLVAVVETVAAGVAWGDARRAGPAAGRPAA